MRDRVGEYGLEGSTQVKVQLEESEKFLVLSVS